MAAEPRRVVRAVDQGASLRDLDALDDKISGLKELITQRVADNRALIEQKLADTDRLITKVNELAEKAVGTALDALKQHLASLNEFRQTLTDLSKTFATDKEMRALLAATAERIATTEARFHDRLVALEKGMTDRIAAIEKANATQVGAQKLPTALWGLGALILVGLVIAFLSTKFSGTP